MSIISFLVTLCTAVTHLTFDGENWNLYKLVWFPFQFIPTSKISTNFNKFLINWVFLQRVSLSPPGHFRLTNDTILPKVLQTWDASQDWCKGGPRGWVKKNDPFSRPLLLDWGGGGVVALDMWIRLEVYHANIKYLYFELHFQIQGHVSHLSSKSFSEKCLSWEKSLPRGQWQGADDPWTTDSSEPLTNFFAHFNASYFLSKISFFIVHHERWSNVVDT